MTVRTQTNDQTFGVLGRVVHLTNFIYLHDRLNDSSAYDSRACIKQIIRNQQYFIALFHWKEKSFTDLTDYEKRSLYFCLHPKLIAVVIKWLESHERGTVINRYTDRTRKADLSNVIAEIIGEVYNVFPDYIDSQQALQQLKNPDQELINDYGESLLIPDNFWMQHWIAASPPPMSHPTPTVRLPNLNLTEMDFE